MINHADSQKNINSSVTNTKKKKKNISHFHKIFLSIVASMQVRNDSLSDPEPEGL